MFRIIIYNSKIYKRSSKANIQVRATNPYFSLKRSNFKISVYNLLNKWRAIIAKSLKKGGNSGSAVKIHPRTTLPAGFFVRARYPDDDHSAVISAKMGGLWLAITNPGTRPVNIGDSSNSC